MTLPKKPAKTRMHQKRSLPVPPFAKRKKCRKSNLETSQQAKKEVCLKCKPPKTAVDFKDGAKPVRREGVRKKSSDQIELLNDCKDNQGGSTLLQDFRGR